MAIAAAMIWLRRRVDVAWQLILLRRSILWLTAKRFPPRLPLLQGQWRLQGKIGRRKKGEACPGITFLVEHKARISRRNQTESRQYLPFLVVLDPQKTVTALADTQIANPEIKLALHDSLLDLMHDLFAVLNRTADAAVRQAIEVFLE